MNIEQSASVDLTSNEIRAYINTEHYNILGEYITKDRAKEVFTELLRERFPKQCISMSASGVNNIPNMEVYYMPEV